jgi:hypothetical protein
MSHVVRRVLLGQVQEVYNSLLSNLSNPGDYDSSGEHARDIELMAVLSSWLRIESILEDDTDASQMDGEAYFSQE